MKSVFSASCQILLFLMLILVSVHGYAIDTDFDGVDDVFDIDDDNDGILDAIESPSCFYSRDEVDTLQVIGSDLIWNASYGYARAADLDEGTFTQLTPAYQAVVGKTVAEYELAAEISIQRIELLMGAYRLSRSASVGEFKLQGWNGVWVDLSTPKFATKVNGFEVFINTLQPTAVFSKLRIRGVSGTAHYARIVESFIILGPYVASLNPKSSLCTEDVDGNGDANHLDLDSDGDGCSDAYESAATADLTANYQFPYVDANNDGLVDAVDIAGDGEVDYIARYHVGKAMSLNACTDTDLDGVGNLSDLDDDNDGVPDAIENPACFFSETEAQTILAAHSDLIWHGSYGFIRANDGDIGTFTQLNPVKQTLVGKTVIQYDLLGHFPVEKLELDMAAYSISASATDGLVVLQGFSAGTWIDLSNVDYATKKNELEIFVNTLAPDRYFSKLRIRGISGSSSRIRIKETALFLNDFSPSLFPKSMCGGLNHLVLDSDGDGCSDAYESGATTDLTPNHQFPYVDFNNDGLVDAVDAMGDGEVDYNPTYYIANSANLDACLDTDLDGVADLFDLDDDNDGVLDAVESPSCFFTEDEAQVISATSSEMLWHANYGFVRATDGDSGTFTQMSPASQSIAGKTIIEYDLVGNFQVEMLKLDMGAYRMSSSASVGEVVFQGFTGGGWINLSGGKFATQTNGFENFNNTLAPNLYFSKLRIQGISGTAYYCRIEETYLLLKTFQASSNPKEICNENNHKVLDSDGDGCSDAFESGATIDLSPSYQFPNVDSNNDGLVDAVDADANGQVDYDLRYRDTAISSAINACLDSDFDGTVDILDLDDDNDGVLDTTESPTCFYSISEMSQVTAVNSDLSWHTTYNFNRTTDNNTATFAQLNPNNQSIEGRTVLAFELAGNFRVQGLDLEMGAYRISRAQTDGLVVLQGWHGTWSDLSQPKYAMVANGVETFVNTLRPGWTFSKLRIRGISGKAYYSRIDEVTVVVENGSSTYPKPTCTNDTDNDGKSNHLDRDSDGEGCSDAYESGATTDLTSLFQFPDVDANNDGLVDAVDANADGVVDYTSTYLFADTSSLDACSDTDGDSIGDLIDIDDDNDGILDIHERDPGFGPQIALTGAIATQIQNYSNSYPPEKAIDGSTTSIAITRGLTTTDWWEVDLGSQKLIGGFEVYARSNVKSSMRNVFVLVSQTPFVGNDLAAARANADFEYQLPNDTTAILLHTIEVGMIMGRYIRLQKSGVNTRNYLEWSELNVFEPQNADRDSDSDGIPDRLDLDSDNDTIPDNIEAQLTDSYIAPGSFTDANNDGLNDLYAPGLIPVDTDADLIADFIDLNSDAEGDFDIIEVGQGALDSNADGRTDGVVGANGLADSIDTADDYSDVNGIINDPTTLPNLQFPGTPEVDYRDDDLSDECAMDTDNCDENATCTNTPMAFTCECNSGFSGDGVTCSDDDECQLGTDNCDVNAICTNTPGSFDCDCPVGYSGDGYTCVANGCGDGTVDPGETCDDSNFISGDGCSDTCFIDNIPIGGDCSENGDLSCQTGLCDTTESTPTCEAKDTCGNGLIEGAESCDDGNTDANDGCSATCSLAGADFNRRFDITSNGAIVTTSNVLITCDEVLDSRCSGAQDFTGPVYQNGPFMMVNVDVDADASTFNSSSSTLTLPANSTIAFAGLYWSGQYSDYGRPYKYTAPPSPEDIDTIRFKVPGAVDYVTLTGTVEETDSSFYQGFVDVTALINGSGEYWVADAQLTTGKQMFGGWTLVVVVEAVAEPMRRMVVWDGFLKHTHYDILLNLTDTFGTRRADSPTEMSIVMYDGDKGNWDSMLLDDEVFFPNNIYSSSDPAPAGDIANSTITKLGVRSEDRNPFFKNTLGYDADVFEISPFINLDSDLNIRFRNRDRGDIKHIGMVAVQSNIAENFVQTDWSAGPDVGVSTSMNSETQFLSRTGNLFHDTLPEMLRASQFSYRYAGEQFEIEPFRSTVPDTGHFALWKNNQVLPIANCLNSQFWLFREIGSNRLSWVAGANQENGGAIGCEGAIDSSYVISGSAQHELSDNPGESTLTGFAFDWTSTVSDGHVINLTSPEFKIDGTILSRTGAVTHSMVLNASTFAEYNWSGSSSWSIESDFDGVLDSKVFDGGSPHSFGNLTFTVIGTNASTAVVYFRTGDSENNVLGKAWEGPFIEGDALGSVATNNKQFFQYRIVTLLADPGLGMPESELNIEQISFPLEPMILPVLNREALAIDRIDESMSSKIDSEIPILELQQDILLEESDWDLNLDVVQATEGVQFDDPSCSSTKTGSTFWLVLFALGFLFRRRSKSKIR